MKPLGEASEYIMDVIRGFDFDPSESSRLARMRDLFRKTSFVPETSGQRFELAAQALRDVLRIAFAFEQLCDVLPDADLRRKIHRLVKDSPLPQDDKQNTPGRDAQSELFVAAVCQASGLNPRFDEPDVVVTCEDREYGLAVKRLKSLDRLGEHFKKAVKQIVGAGLPGFVVLDMVLAANPENAALCFAINDARFRQLESNRFRPLIREHLADFMKWKAGHPVRGVIILDHVAGPVDEERHWGLKSWTHFEYLEPHNQRKRREASQFFGKFKSGLPNLARL